MKKRNIVLSVLLVLVAATAIYVGSTYAKYVSSFTGNASVEVAKWGITVDGSEMNGTPVSKTMTCTFDPAVTTKVLGDRVAPGRNCYFDVAIDPTGTEVAFDYSIAVGTPTAGTKPVNMTVSPTAKSGGITWAAAGTDVTLTGTGPWTGSVALGDAAMAATDGVVVRVALTWPYETTEGDDEDTADGITASDVTVPVTVTLTQQNPN